VISVIKDEQGNSMVDHNQKANALWTCYKNRMGVTNASATQADISHLIYPVEGLEILSKEFTVEEIEGVVKHMKTDRAPGPDGFNGLFVKKCWPIIKDDFINL
jgi:hypothetical protein